MITNARGEKEMFCIDVDLSDRERAERALRESEQRYRVLAENYPDGALFLFDRDLRYLSADGQELAHVGLSRDDIVGRRIDEVFAEQAHVIVPNCRAVVERGESRTYQITYRDNIYDNAVIPIRNAEGRILCGIAITRNVTQQKQMEQKIRQMEKMEAVGRLAGGVAHDFNNMLTVILGNTQIALDQDLPAEIRESLEEIHRAGKRSAELTSQLLAFARKQTVAPEVLDLNETLEGMLKMLRRLIGEAIDLAWMPGGRLWAVRIDPGQVSQVLANLCVNARDAIQGVGKMTIETANVELDADFAGAEDGFQPGQYVMLAVSDDGQGMDDQTRARAFEPFFTTKPEGQGTGLGLATVYGIVKQNNGLVNLYSEPGKGSTFRIYLPRHQANVADSPVEQQQQVLPGGNETVLLVEDDPSILRLGQTLLGRLGYDVLSAEGPAEAIELVQARSEPIQLLVTDVIMPEMNGRELYDAVGKAHPETGCLYMSGYTANIIAHHGVLEEGVLFLQKPFSRQELACRVRQALDRNDRSK
jgi:PAS domain S-box-containing protein